MAGAKQNYENKTLTTLFFDAGFFACQLAQIEQTSSAEFTPLVNINLLNILAVDWENTLHTYTV